VFGGLSPQKLPLGDGTVTDPFITDNLHNGSVINVVVCYEWSVLNGHRSFPVWLKAKPCISGGNKW